MNHIIQRMRKQRELKVTVDKFVFVARRPTDSEFAELHRSAMTKDAIAKQFVVGWENVTENDVAGGGGSDALVFDREVWAEWCGDRAEFWAPIAEAILDAYMNHAKRLETAAKN